jgi:hypothetical protein
VSSRLVVLLALAFVAPQTAVAQSPATRNGLGLDSLTFAQLQTMVASQDSVRVDAMWGQVVLRGPTLTSDSLLAGPDSSGEPGPRVGLVAVKRIQAWRGASGTGARVGAIVGLAAGLAGSIALSASLCSEGGCDNEAGGTMVITAGSTAAGALLGGLLGAGIKTWRTVYRSGADQHTPTGLLNTP